MTKQNRSGEPMRKVMRRQRYVQTYNYVYTLDCGHEINRPVSARRADLAEAHPKSVGCWQCQRADPVTWHKPTYQEQIDAEEAKHLAKTAKMSDDALREHMETDHDTRVKEDARREHGAMHNANRIRLR